MATTTAQKPSTTTAERHKTDYELPLVHVRIPERVGNAAFWLGVGGAVAGGAVELPVAALVAAGVLVLRHRPKGA